MNKRIRIAIVAVVIVVLGASVWLWATAGRETTDDAQVDAHVTPVAARVGGTVIEVPVKENQQVEAGTVLVVIDPRDYQVALEKARAEVATAEADAAAARVNIPITSTAATGNVSNARGGVEQAEAGIDTAQRGIEAATARLATAQARQREAEANAARTAKDVERFKGLLAKDEIAQQQYDAAVAAADAARAAADSAKAQVQEAQAGISVAQSQLMQARAGHTQAAAQLQTAQTAPEQVAAQRARASSADARVLQQRAALQQAELNVQYTTLKAPMKGIVSKKGVEVGQVIQPGQPLMTVIPLEEVWVTANFKETQLQSMRPGQPAVIEVDAYGGREFKAHVESLAAATGSRFSLLPPENATGNFVKVVQRVPVRIVLDEKQDAAQLLRPGMSVTAKVYTK
ncbi:MAG TPA: HlyD family secretion protein [Vicinamibacterales bacterium]|nr:HlyD family secretion protein [Vicinamibacterales bacterium]